MARKRKVKKNEKQGKVVEVGSWYTTSDGDTVKVTGEPFEEDGTTWVPCEDGSGEALDVAMEDLLDKAEKPSSSDDDDELVGWDDEDVITPDDIEKATTDPTLIPEGQYEFEIVRAESVAPTQGRPGGYRVTFKVVVPPDNVEAPADGWPAPSRLFRKWLPADLTEGRQTSQRFDRTDLLRLIAAAKVDTTGGVKLSEAVKALVGRHVLARVRHREAANRNTPYQDIIGFQSIEE